LRYLTESMRVAGCQERTEDVAANRVVALVVDRPRVEHRFHRAERRLDHPELFVGQRDVARREGGVRAQDPQSVIACVGVDLWVTNREARALTFEKPSISLVADQRLVAVRQRGAQGADDRVAVVGILARLLLVATDDVPMIADRHLFHLQRRDVMCRRAWGEHRGERAVGVDHRLRLRTPRM
jgi:hypothetical protein